MLDTNDLRYHTEVGTGYSKDAMLERAADEIDSLRKRIEKTNIFSSSKNYLISFLLCMSGTIIVVLTKNPDWYWLIISNASVALGCLWLTGSILIKHREQ